MRVHRLTLRDYRGVSSCELTFAERGVTVVEGDNEVGKSSAAEALHLLVEYRDDSTRKEVKAVRPLHRDAGAEVEADISVGSLRFTYAKRWHRDRYTRLKVVSPAPEVHSGREAHDRVRALLADTVDLDLWRALSAPQGEGLQQAALRDHPSLVGALDVAAGGALGTAGESDLLTKAEAEASRWFTPLGKAKAPLLELRRRSTDAAAAVAACAEAIARVEADASWCADLQRRATDLEPKRAAAVLAAERAGARLAAAHARHAAVESLAVVANLAHTRVQLAEIAIAGRAAVAERAEAAAAALVGAEQRAAAAQTAHTAATHELSAATADAHAAAAAAEAADAAVADAHAAHDRAKEAGDLADVVAGLARLELLVTEATEARHALDEAGAALSACRSTPAALAGVQAAHDDVLRAEAALTASEAVVRVDARRALQLAVDGEVATLVPGGSLERPVTGTIVVDVPDTVRITVTAGAGVATLSDRLQAAAAVLAARCAALGVRDLAGARALEERRRALGVDVEARRVALGAALGGTTLDQLTALADDARDALAAGRERGVEPASIDLEPLRLRRDELSEERHRAERIADQAGSRVATASLAAKAATATVLRAAAEVAAAGAEAERAGVAVTAERAGASEEVLAAAAGAARAEAETATSAWRKAAAESVETDLPLAEQAARRTAIERAGAERSLTEVREELAGVRSRLELQGEGGLHDRLADARRVAAAVEDERTSVEARAAAARLLVTTLTRHRDEAARAYGAPLRTELEALGRLVFGATFAVVLDDQLRISSRVLAGVPVPWDDLSVGTREQLAVLNRLAAATLVSTGGGVPVVFDDVLGFSDPDRLALVSAAFEAAAEHCQIIVLTCDPDRYRHLARATTHCLTAPRTVADRQAG